MGKYKIIWASSTVWKCSNGHWYLRIPDFIGEPFDKGSECEICGVTSFKSKKGRPFGIKSKDILKIQEMWDSDEDFWISWLIDMEKFGCWNNKDVIKTIPNFNEISGDNL